MIQIIEENINKEGKTKKDLFFKSPSGLSVLASNKIKNGWLSFKNKEDKTLDEVYRKNK